MSGVEVQRVAERALLVRFADDPLAVAVARAQALAAALASRRLPGMGECVLGAGNVLLLFASPPPMGWDELGAVVERLARHPAATASDPTRRLEVEVDYGGEAGPDLGAVARALELSEQRVIELHSSALYTVAFVGFAPGFPYLIGLPRALELPRLDSPRAAVPAGSVAIAGPFAGIYPSATPGGWHLLGRTGVRLFDAGAARPARLAPGDRVRFVRRGERSP